MQAKRLLISTKSSSQHAEVGSGWLCGQITLPKEYLDPKTLPKGTVVPYNETSLAPPNATKTLLVNLTQPLMPNGQLRWGTPLRSDRSLSHTPLACSLSMSC